MLLNIDCWVNMHEVNDMAKSLWTTWLVTSMSGLFSGCCHQVGNTQFIRRSLYAGTLLFPFTGTKGSKYMCTVMWSQCSCKRREVHEYIVCPVWRGSCVVFTGHFSSTPLNIFVLDQLERLVHPRPPQPTSEPDLTNALVTEWSQIPTTTFHNLVERFLRRVTS